MSLATLALTASVMATGQAGAVLIDQTTYGSCLGHQICNIGTTRLSFSPQTSDFRNPMFLERDGLSVNDPRGQIIIEFASRQVITELQIADLAAGEFAVVVGNDNGHSGGSLLDGVLYNGLTDADLTLDAAGVWHLSHPFGDSDTDVLVFGHGNVRQAFFSILSLSTRGAMRRRRRDS
jgi:hypothetical protein